MYFFSTKHIIYVLLMFILSLIFYCYNLCILIYFISIIMYSILLFYRLNENLFFL